MAKRKTKAATYRASRDSVGYRYASELERRNPYIVAQRLYLNGHITTEQAAAMAATDRDFIAELAMKHDMADILLGDNDDSTRYLAALRIVEKRWKPQAVAQRLAEKRREASAPSMTQGV